MHNILTLATSPHWEDYDLLDSGNRRRLERFGKYTLSRPDPQAIWSPSLSDDEWKQCDAYYKQEREGKGYWIFNTNLPDKWVIAYKKLRFYARTTPFKHTGIFPEQAIHWDWIGERINARAQPTNILNLFAYTGGSTLACAEAGASVTHLDASKPAITWARENQIVSGLTNKPIRWIPDDALKFTAREIKRDVKYDGIILDPPVYGHGPAGETWDFYKDVPQLLENCRQLLSNSPLFIIINAYAVSASAVMLENLLSDMHIEGKIEVGELTLEESKSKRLLSTGIYGKWMRS